MEALFSAVNAICGKIQIVSNWFWDFPTNLDWYASIPILGNFSLAIILLVGTGIYFTFKLRFVQVRKFKYGLQVLMNSKSTTMGISSLGAFLLSTAMRVGPGNILGVTGAISIGGPGALFWMWISAFFGMATAFVESTMSQIFKEKRGDAYVGGLPFYGRRLLKDAAWAGVAERTLHIYCVSLLSGAGLQHHFRSGSHRWCGDRNDLCNQFCTVLGVLCSVNCGNRGYQLRRYQESIKGNRCVGTDYGSCVCTDRCGSGALQFHPGSVVLCSYFHTGI